MNYIPNYTYACTTCWGRDPTCFCNAGKAPFPTTTSLSLLIELLKLHATTSGCTPEVKALIDSLLVKITPINPLKNPLQPFQTIANRCHKCMLDLSKPMGYCCPNSECPVQPRVT